MACFLNIIATSYWSILSNFHGIDLRIGNGNHLAFTWAEQDSMCHLRGKLKNLRDAGRADLSVLHVLNELGPLCLNQTFHLRKCRRLAAEVLKYVLRDMMEKCKSKR